MQQILLVLQVLLAVGLIALVLLQQGQGANAGAAFGGGASGSVFGSRGPTSFLVKLTALLAAAFFINSVTLAYIATASLRDQSVIEAPASGSDKAPAQGDTAPKLKTDVPSLPSEGSATQEGGDVPTLPETGQGESQN